VVGERWSLLIVRELLEGPRRYGDLLAGLPGIATNLLADRLRRLESDGVVQRLGGARYALTPWGAELREAVYALGRWAGPRMERPRGSDAYQPSWMRHFVGANFDGVDAARRNLTVELRCGGEPMTLVSRAGRVHLRAGAADSPDVTLGGPPDATIGVLLGRIDPATAQRYGVEVRGDASRLTGLRARA